VVKHVTALLTNPRASGVVRMASAAQWLLLLATSLLHLADAAHAFRYAPLTITSPPEPYQTHPHYVYDLARRTTLARRQTETTTANTCGWTSADAKKPATCPIGQGCGWWHGTVPSENGVVCVPFDSSGDWEWNGESSSMASARCMGYYQACERRAGGNHDIMVMSGTDAYVICVQRHRCQRYAGTSGQRITPPMSPSARR